MNNKHDTLVHFIVCQKMGSNLEKIKKYRRAWRLTGNSGDESCDFKQASLGGPF